MKFGLLAEYNTRNFSKQNHAENEAGRLVPDKSNYTVTIWYTTVGVQGLQYVKAWNFIVPWLIFKSFCVS